MEAIEFEFAAAVTNKATYVAYRGPWAAETFCRERMVDIVAKELGLEPLEVRRRNIAYQGDKPATMVTGRSLVGATARESVEKMAELVDLPSFRARQAEARKEGRYIGIGMATYIEAAPGPRGGGGGMGNETMRMRLEADGTLTVFTAQMPHGQSHETTLAQIAADEFGVPFEQVKVVVGDSDQVPFGFTGWTHRPLGTMVLGLAYRTGVPWNEAKYSNKDFDNLLTTAEGTLDVAKRREIMAKLEAILQDDGPIVQPLWRSVFTFMDKRVQGFKMHPTQYIFGNQLGITA